LFLVALDLLIEHREAVMRLRERFQAVSTVNTIDVILPVLISLFFFYVFFLDKRLAVLLVMRFIFRAMKDLVGRHVISFIRLLMSAVMFIMMMSFWHF